MLAGDHERSVKAPYALAESGLSNPSLSDDVVAAIVSRGEHVVVAEALPRGFMDGTAARLAALRCRVVRPSTLDHVTLPNLLTQISDDDPERAAGALDLEAGFDLLTRTGPDCDRIVLVLDHADALDPAALRYLCLVARDAPLRLLFAAGPALAESLEPAGFRRLPRTPLPVATMDLPIGNASPEPIMDAEPVTVLAEKPIVPPETVPPKIVMPEIVMPEVFTPLVIQLAAVLPGITSKRRVGARRIAISIFVVVAAVLAGVAVWMSHYDHWPALLDRARAVWPR